MDKQIKVGAEVTVSKDHFIKEIRGKAGVVVSVEHIVHVDIMIAGERYTVCDHDVSSAEAADTEPFTLTTGNSTLILHDLKDRNVCIEVPAGSITLTPAQLDELIFNLDVIRRARDIENLKQ